MSKFNRLKQDYFYPSASSYSMGSHPQFVQLCSRHLPPEKLQSGPCFLHVQRLLSHSVLQLQRIIEILCGAGCFFFFHLVWHHFSVGICHPNSDGFNVSFPTHDCTWW